MILRGKVWHYDFIIGGVRHRGSTGCTDRKAAEAAVNALKVQLSERHSVQMVWEQTRRKLISADKAGALITEELLYSAYMRSADSRLGKSRDGMVRHMIRLFTEFVGAGVRVSDYTAADAQRYIDHVKALSVSPYTKNIRVGTVRRCFNALGRDYGIMEDLFAGYARQRESSEAREAFTPEELRLIGENAKGWMYSLCLTALSTGLREGDICNMRQSSVDLAGGWITVKTGKTGARVDIPILPGLRAHLVERMSTPGEWVFPELHDAYASGKGRIGREVKDFFRSIGITGATRHVDGYARDVSVKDVHSFRHTFVYLAAVHGVPFPVVQGVVGHASPAMTKHYMDHAGREAKAQYLAQLPDYLSGGAAVSQEEADRRRLLELIPALPPDKVRQMLELV